MGKQLPRAEDFTAWLDSNVELSQRAVRDVVSRARRAWLMADLGNARTDAEIVRRLEEVPTYRTSSASVRSQLKRSVRLYREFVSRR